MVPMELKNWLAVEIVINNNPTRIRPSVQRQAAGDSALELLLYAAICQEQLPEDVHPPNAPATLSGGQI